jgi:hypothetical protein
VRVAVLVVAAAVASSCGGGGAATISRDDRRSGDVFELRATVSGSLEIVRRGNHDFAPLHGKLVGAFAQSPPGTPPHFGEGAYWFGPALGAARAKTLLEHWGLDWERFPPERQLTQYETVYRLPPSALPAELANERRSNYPGLGEKPPSEVWVTCEPRQRGFLPAVGRGTRPRALRLATGERAQLYSGGFVLHGREGVTSVIVVGRTVCIVDGLVPPAQFRALARTLHRPG